MPDCEPIYVAYNGDSFVAIYWETPRGKILTIKGDIDINDTIDIRDVSTGDSIRDIDMKEILLEVMQVGR